MGAAPHLCPTLCVAGQSSRVRLQRRKLTTSKVVVVRAEHIVKCFEKTKQIQSIFLKSRTRQGDLDTPLLKSSKNDVHIYNQSVTFAQPSLNLSWACTSLAGRQLPPPLLRI